MASSKAKKPDYAELRELFKPHIESFDYFIDKGMEIALKSIKPCEVEDPSTNTKLRIYLGEPTLLNPKEATSTRAISPQQCREAKTTYKGELTVELFLQYNEGPAIRNRINFGYFPIMLMSKRCNLRGSDPQTLIKHREEATEMGGYFICNGLERLCRLVIVQKRNYPMSLVRGSFRTRGEGYSDKAVVMRCVQEDQSSVTVKLYYLLNGSARLGFWIRGREYLLPVGIVLKALIDASDREIYVSLTCCYNERYRREMGAVGTQLVGERAQIILDEVRKLSLLTQSDCLRHLGEYFKTPTGFSETEDCTVVAQTVLRDYILVHLNSNHDKYNLLIFMLQKLYALVDQTAAPDNGDVLQNQEVLLPGHFISVYFKEKVMEWLGKAKRQLSLEINKGNKFNFKDPDQIKKLLGRSSGAISRSIESMIKIGRLATPASLDLPQKEGVTIQAERLNYLRFISHFRAVHRGAAFAKLRTTSVRKLMPESWGFLCPVHTPDGEPCGLLNHMTSTCRVTSYFNIDGKIKDFRGIQRSIVNIMVRLGMSHLLSKFEHAGPPEVLQVLLDGRLIGSIACSEVEKVVAHLRHLKLSAASGIPDDLEVGYIPLSFGGAYPGLYLFSSPSRFLRPVRNVTHTTNLNIELIGPFEQAFMEIRCADGGDGGRRSFTATHEEIHPTSILSVVANLTPWSDHNQSPRNMYQCQMAKQTMGFSSQALKFRSDVKTYHLQTPQSPIVRTAAYEKYCVDEFPTGTNAIVAVLAYTGYDMEDAMILNKSSVDRGLCRGHIYQTESIDLADRQEKSGAVKVFSRSSDRTMNSSIDSDGLPYIGQVINPKEPLYCTYDTLTSVAKPTLLKGLEPVIIDTVTAVGTSSKSFLQKVNIRTRRIRNPVIGDKFSSRHGQKGVCSQLWPDVDMPFSAVTGMRPDLIINPHAFPSRMTIGMLLESVAAKAGSLHGKFVDATPFASSVDKGDGQRRSEQSSLVDELGPMLASCGFNYHGSEVLYSGYYGTEMTCEIFIGPVYYQRLRHMVSDKYQVRSTGTLDPITRQPVGGRKRGGGIRFGEMERDSILAHGAAYLLHDRLHTCSDYHIAEVCSICGSILTATVMQQQKRVVPVIPGIPQTKPPKSFTCHACKSKKGMETVAMPYVFRYLAAELAAMNIKMELKLSSRAGC